MHDYSNDSSERTSSSAGSWTKYGKLVTKRIYVGSNKKTRERIVILTLIFVDREGQQFELKSFNQEKKIYSVNRKANCGSSYKISGRGALGVPNDVFSTSKYYSSIRSWWITEIPDFGLLQKVPYKPINLNDSIKYYIDKGKAVNMIGTFQGLFKGQDARYIKGKATIFGYYVILLDEYSGQKFQVLVWHTPTIDKSKSIFEAIFGAKKGDVILINDCRSSYLPKGASKEHQNYTLTSLMQPVVSPPKELYID